MYETENLKGNWDRKVLETNEVHSGSVMRIPPDTAIHEQMAT